MPNWKFHNDWAVKLGISRDVANWVNKREDLLQFEKSDDKGLQRFKESMPDSQPTYNEMASKGTDYLRAWILHILIDEIEDICENLSKNSIGEYKHGADLYKEAKEIYLCNYFLRLVPDDILSFVSTNLNELIQDIPVPYFHLSRGMLLGLKDGPTHNLESPKIGRSLPSPLSINQVRMLLEQPAKENTSESRRDEAMLHLLYATGMRVSELVSLDLKDIDLADGNIHVFGKGSKERLLPVYTRAIKVLETYLRDVRPKLARDNDENAVFLNRHGERLTRQGFWQILKQYTKAAGITSPVTPYTLRHSFAAHMLNGGVSLKTLQELLGHANIATTKIYTQLPNEYVRQV
jgi:integrase